MNSYFVAPSGYIFYACLFLFGIALAIIVDRFEREYPDFRVPTLNPLDSEEANNNRSTNTDIEDPKVRRARGLPPTPMGTLNATLEDSGSFFERPKTSVLTSLHEKSQRGGGGGKMCKGDSTKKKKEVSGKLEMTMMVIYPVTLATVECAAQVVLKGWTGMLLHIMYPTEQGLFPDTNNTIGSYRLENVTADNTTSIDLLNSTSMLNTTESGSNVVFVDNEARFSILLGHGAAIFWSICTVNAVCIALIIVWLRKVYSKFETGECLPIE